MVFDQSGSSFRPCLIRSENSNSEHSGRSPCDVDLAVGCTLASRLPPLPPHTAVHFLFTAPQAAILCSGLLLRKTLSSQASLPSSHTWLFPWETFVCPCCLVLHTPGSLWNLAFWILVVNTWPSSHVESLGSHGNYIPSGSTISLWKTVTYVTKICVNQRNQIIYSFPDTLQTALGNNPEREKWEYFEYCKWSECFLIEFEWKWARYKTQKLITK